MIYYYLILGIVAILMTIYIVSAATATRKRRKFLENIKPLDTVLIKPENKEMVVYKVEPEIIWVYTDLIENGPRFKRYITLSVYPLEKKLTRKAL